MGGEAKARKENTNRAKLGSKRGKAQLGKQAEFRRKTSAIDVNM